MGFDLEILMRLACWKFRLVRRGDAPGCVMTRNQRQG